MQTISRPVVKHEPLRVHIRWMIRVDMATVLAIEQASFSEPWSDEDFLHALRQRNTIGMVATRFGKMNGVVGFMVYELNEAQFDLLNFAVSSEHRFRSIGRQMVQKLCGKLSPWRRRAITLHVRETNLSAQLFFQSMGFRSEGVCQRFYDDTDEDAYRMAYRLPTDQAAAEEIPANRINWR